MITILYKATIGDLAKATAGLGYSVNNLKGVEAMMKNTSLGSTLHAFNKQQEQIKNITNTATTFKPFGNF